MPASTTLRRSRARSGLRNGERRDGDWMMPAMRRGLGQRDVAHVLAEEDARGLRDAVNLERPALAEHDVVQVQLEDLVLGEARLEHERHELFLELAAQGLLRRQERVLDDLLRDRAAADQVRAGRRDSS